MIDSANFGLVYRFYCEGAASGAMDAFPDHAIMTSPHDARGNEIIVFDVGKHSCHGAYPPIGYCSD